MLRVLYGNIHLLPADRIVTADIRREDEMKYHIEENTIQETLVIPLFGRLICSEHFPDLFLDEQAERICDSLDYDFSEKRKKMESTVGLFGALEVAQRQYDLCCEVKEYLKDHPEDVKKILYQALLKNYSKFKN